MKLYKYKYQVLGEPNSFNEYKYEYKDLYSTRTRSELDYFLYSAPGLLEGHSI